MESKIEIFCVYARKDLEYLKELRIHLTPLERQGLVKIWNDIDISPGMQWEDELHRHLNTAQIILLLVSPDFMASDYCYDIEMERAIKRHKRGEARVIPVIIRPTHWQVKPLAALQALPKNAKPITVWENRDAAFLDVVQSLQRTIDEIIIQNDISLSYRPVKVSTPGNYNNRKKRIEPLHSVRHKIDAANEDDIPKNQSRDYELKDLPREGIRKAPYSNGNSIPFSREEKSKIFAGPRVLRASRKPPVITQSPSRRISLYYRKILSSYITGTIMIIIFIAAAVLIPSFYANTSMITVMSVSDFSTPMPTCTPKSRSKQFSTPTVTPTPTCTPRPNPTPTLTPTSLVSP